MRPALKEWTSDQLYDFISTTQFQDCKNVIKYGKITGSKLLAELDKEFMIGTLGIIGENEQMKFKTEIDMITSQKVLSVQLYGWGQNVNHNLATYNCNVVQ